MHDLVITGGDRSRRAGLARTARGRRDRRAPCGGGRRATSDPRDGRSTPGSGSSRRGSSTRIRIPTRSRLMSEPQPFKLMQGVTTEIVGNCGFSVAPLDDTSAAYAEEAWGDLFPGVAVDAGSFADYLDRVDAAGPTNNIARARRPRDAPSHRQRHAPRALGRRARRDVRARRGGVPRGGGRALDRVDLRSGYVRADRRDRDARPDRGSMAPAVRHPHAGRGRAARRGAG